VVVSFVDGGENLLVVFSFCIQSNKVRGDCSFVDIGENVDHHCLNILFMLYVYFPPHLRLYRSASGWYNLNANGRHVDD
jgi:hypothetical protein